MKYNNFKDFTLEPLKQVNLQIKVGLDLQGPKKWNLTNYWSFLGI